ncbi:caspase family protein [Ornithinimicrobium ciconiae]|uniref:Caspase family protein n=1 Tax=Ornithinimicrobium ciconiae TaxID=2594265 RepID=A0A516G6C2_9MICO|nr:caspase family protein [Ornithinimicrobium ciconiae]QDO87076.1 caspase family protein [Ornithinimicrobium ciconiae]
MTPARRALVVGIDNYISYNNLAGCVNDARALAPVLARNEDDSPNFEVRTLTAPATTGRVTRDELLEALDQLFAPGADMSLLYFAGHGAQVGDGGDVVLVTTDATRQTPGVRFTEIMERVNDCTHEVAVILDCCFSGGAGGVPAAMSQGAILRQGVSMLTASRADQTSAETLDGRGQFSAYLEGALEGGAADVLGHLTLAGLYAYLSEAFGTWDQRPMFKANVDRLQDIRRCDPSVPLETLRQLPVWFPEADALFALDPTYEPDKRESNLPPNPEHEGIFKQLQKCQSAKLVEPAGAEHMYFAAMQSQACRLTPLGRHYHHLASAGRI